MALFPTDPGSLPKPPPPDDDFWNWRDRRNWPAYGLILILALALLPTLAAFAIDAWQKAGPILAGG